VAAGAVLDHHRLAPVLAHPLSDQACDDIGRPARRKRHDDADRPIGIIFCVRVERRLRPRVPDHHREGDRADDDASRHRHGQSSFMPTAWMTLARVSACERMKAANSSGVLLLAGSMPALSSFSRTSRSASTFLIDPCSFTTTSRGVPAGATMLCQMPRSYPGKVSAMVGMAGASG